MQIDTQFIFQTSSEWKDSSTDTQLQILFMRGAIKTQRCGHAFRRRSALARELQGRLYLEIKGHYTVDKLVNW